MTVYDDSAQKFVDALNMKLMPQLGYVWRALPQEPEDETPPRFVWQWPNVITGFWEYREKWDQPLVATGEPIHKH